MIPENIFKKIKKLLALSADVANEHEAALAGEMAQRLLEKHHLSLGELNLEDSTQCGEASLNFKSRIPVFERILAVTIVHLCDVEAVTRTSFSLSGRTNNIFYLGLSNNVELAILTHQYYRNAIAHFLLKRFQSSGTVRNRSFAREYRTGAAIGIAQAAGNLKKHRVNAVASSHAITVVSRGIAKRYMEGWLAGRDFRTGNRRKLAAISRDPVARSLGYHDAKNISVQHDSRALMDNG
jgi:hypothetical protein